MTYRRLTVGLFVLVTITLLPPRLFAGLIAITNVNSTGNSPGLGIESGCINPDGAISLCSNNEKRTLRVEITLEINQVLTMSTSENFAAVVSSKDAGVCIR